MRLSGLDLFFWMASFFGHLCLLAVLWKKRLIAQFPLFTTWIATSVIRSLALFFILRHGSENAYFYAYWSLAILDMSLQILVVLELVVHIFRPIGTWAPGVRGSFIWLLVGSTLIASTLTWLASPPTHSLRQAFVIRGNFFSSVLMSELFVGMIVFSVTMGLPWRTSVARIAQGLGLYSMLGILIDILHNYFGVAGGTHAYSTLSHIRIGIYLSCLGYWIGTLAQTAPVPAELPERMRRQLFLLNQWVEVELQRLQVWR